VGEKKQLAMAVGQMPQSARYLQLLEENVAEYSSWLGREEQHGIGWSDPSLARDTLHC
jgi:hypothetical protein